MSTGDALQASEFIHDFHKSEILTGGTYNPNFLKYLANKFNLNVENVHENCLTSAIIYAIDFFNKNTNNCFYSLLKDFKQENIYLLKKKEEQNKVILEEELDPVYFSFKGDLYPYMLISIKSGSSFIRVDSATEFKKISGTAIGASTLVGISNLLWKINDPTDVLSASAEGDSTKVDMTVGDIYGDANTQEILGLPPTLLASSFGKLKDLS